RIDILVNNAGIAGPNVKTWDYPPEAWAQGMSINLDGPFHCCRALVPDMNAQNYGRNVNIASIPGKEGNPNRGGYAAPNGSSPARERRNRLTGIALMTGAVACFASLDASAKYLNASVDTLEVVRARYTSAFLLALILSNPLTRPGVMTTRRPLLQVGRSALLLGSTMLNFFALKFLQLDEALSILFSTPFLVAVLSGPMLGERMGWRRWSAIGVGFAGVLVVTRPGLGGIHPAALLSLA